MSRARPPTERDQEYEFYATRSPGLSRGSKAPGLITALVKIWRMGQTALRRGQIKHHLGVAHQRAAQHCPRGAHRHFNGGRSGRRAVGRFFSGAASQWRDLVLECVSDLQQVLTWTSDNCASHDRASTSAGVATCSTVATASVRESGSWAVGAVEKCWSYRYDNGLCYSL